MATFEQLQKANEQIRTTNIKGKEYAEVNQRIKAFRMVYPEGSIFTEMLSNENGVCIFRATVHADGDHVTNNLLGTGHAYEKESSTYINKTSYIENCETSAVGRALGMAGFGIDTSVASAEEVETAIANQPISATKAKTLEKMILKYNLNVADICAYYGHESLSDFTGDDFASCMKKLEATGNEKGAENE